MSSTLLVVSRGVAVRASVVGTIAASSIALHAQTVHAIPIRTLASSTAVSKDTVGPVVAVRALSNGSVLINDLVSRRVVLFDATLDHSKIVIDTIGGAGPDAPVKINPPVTTLIRYVGDSSLYADRLGKSLVVLDANGKVARVMSIPRPDDVPMLGYGGQVGDPGLDSQGRLVYRGVFPQPYPKKDPDRPWLPSIPAQVDSAPIVRANLDTRTIDTLASLKLNVGLFFNRLDVDPDGNILVRMWADPFDVDDQWALLSDGTIAVVSAHDYHVEWTDPDGTHRSTPKMPFDWRKLTEADKLRMIDSLRPALERLNSIPPRRINTPSGPRMVRQQFEFLPLEKIRDFELAIEAFALKADLDARLWILPKTSLRAKDGLLYDVINRKGEIVERVQFPKDYVLGGFGEHGVLYVVHVNGRRGTLERTTVK